MFFSYVWIACFITIRDFLTRSCWYEYIEKWVTQIIHALLWHFEPVWWYERITANRSKSECVNIKRYVSVISDRQTAEDRIEDLHVPFSFKHIRWNCKNSTVPETKKKPVLLLLLSAISFCTSMQRRTQQYDKGGGGCSRQMI